MKKLNQPCDPLVDPLFCSNFSNGLPVNNVFLWFNWNWNILYDWHIPIYRPILIDKYLSCMIFGSSMSREPFKSLRVSVVNFFETKTCFKILATSQVNFHSRITLMRILETWYVGNVLRNYQKQFCRTPCVVELYVNVHKCTWR